MLRFDRELHTSVLALPDFSKLQITPFKLKEIAVLGSGFAGSWSLMQAVKPSGEAGQMLEA